MPDGTSNNHSGQRFWFGHLSDKKGGSLVIWDRNGPDAPDGSIYLYVYKRDAIVQFAADLVKEHLSPADNAEIKYLSGDALRSYFQALQQYYEKVREHRAEHNPRPELLAGEICSACGGSGYERGQLYGLIDCCICGGIGRTY